MSSPADTRAVEPLSETEMAEMERWASAGPSNGAPCVDMAVRLLATVRARDEQIAALRADARALHEALRRRVVDVEDSLLRACWLCDSNFKDGPEQHAEGCLAAPRTEVPVSLAEVQP